jgi:hypothetical protein
VVVIGVTAAPLGVAASVRRSHVASQLFTQSGRARLAADYGVGLLVSAFELHVSQATS